MNRNLLRGASPVMIMAAAQPAAGTDAQHGIMAVIGDQIRAFQANDLDRAFSFASPTIRTIFGTPANFGLMVRSGYPMVWRPSRVTYLGLRHQNGVPIERIMAIDRAGKAWLLDYRMMRLDGQWRIDAVWLVPDRGAGA